MEIKIEELDFKKVNENKGKELPPKLLTNSGLLTKCLKEIEDINALADNGRLITSGFENVDKYLCSVLPTELLILKAHAGVGKTNFALNMFSHNIRKGKNCIFFSLEMSATELISRLGNIMNNLNGELSRGNLKGDVRDREQKKLVDFLKDLKKLDTWFIVDSKQMQTKNVEEIIALCLTIKEHKGWNSIDCIFIDYAQRIAPTFPNKDEYPNNVYNLTRIQDYCDKEETALVMIVSQNADNKIKGGTNFIYDADNIIDISNADGGLLEVNFEKNRHGALGKVYLAKTGGLRFQEVEIQS